MGDGQADPLLPADRATASRSSGTSARRRGTTSSTTRGSKEENSRAGISTLRGSVKGRAESVAEKIRVELELRGLLDEPVGVDVIELPVLFALQEAGITVADGQALMQDVRMIKTEDEITLLNTACAMVDSAYDHLYRAMKPGFRENDCVALVNKVLFELGSEHVEGVNAISGERCSPHPHVFTDRMLRPGEPAYFDILHAYNGYRTCYYRTFAVGSASRALVDAYARCRDILDNAISMIRPGVTTAEVVETVPEGGGVRLPGRGGRVRAAVRARHRALDLGEAGLLAARLVRLSRDDSGEHGVRARDVLAVGRRLVGGAHRGAARRHEGRLRGDHALPRRGAPRHRRRRVHRRRRPAGRARDDVEPEQPAVVDAVVASAAFEGSNAV